jgi:hypothetical protein
MRKYYKHKCSTAVLGGEESTPKGHAAGSAFKIGYLQRMIIHEVEIKTRLI